MHIPSHRLQKYVHTNHRYATLLAVLILGREAKEGEDDSARYIATPHTRAS